LTELLIPTVSVPAEGGDEDAQGLAVESSSPAKLAFRRYLRHRAAMVATVVLLLIALAVIFAPLIAPYTPNERVGDQRVSNVQLLSPSTKYYFGTDSIGRDLFSRILWGGRASLFIGLAVALASGLIGTAVGAYAGFRGGRFDNALMRLTDLFLAFPILVTLLIVETLPNHQKWARTVLGPPGTLRLMVTLLTLVGWMSTARIVRGVVLSLKEKEFVEAARALGATDRRIITRHLVPNSLGPIIVSMTFTTAIAIGLESTISFFGLGISPIHASWGSLLSDSKGYILSGKWWLVLFPCLVLLFTVLSVNFIGDGLRDALDPKQNRHR
jgi:ABC-type dipeptide/oligopeptide/nickel transport system permease subunit